MFVGIFGQRGNGKSMLADLILSRCPSHWQKTAFALELKLTICRMFGVTLHFIEEWKNKPEPPPGFQRPMRDLLKALGEMARQWKDDIWVSKVLHGPSFRVIEDGRHVNEASALRDLGYPTVLLYRPGHRNDDPHPSEASIIPYRDLFISQGVRGLTGHPLFHYFVVNDGDPSSMLDQIEPLIALTS